jgi:hypothetical protein
MPLSELRLVAQGSLQKLKLVDLSLVSYIRKLTEVKVKHPKPCRY